MRMKIGQVVCYKIGFEDGGRRKESDGYVAASDKIDSVPAGIGQEKKWAGLGTARRCKKLGKEGLGMFKGG